MLRVLVRMKQVEPGYVFDVITRGFGAMYDLSDRITPADRWAITAYVRVLQRSQNARLEDLPETEQRRLLAEAGVDGR